MIEQHYWMQKDSGFVANYLDEYRAKWSLYTLSPFKQAWVRNFIYYYSSVIQTNSWDTSLVFEGVEGELVRMYAPKARVLIRKLVALATKERLSFQAMARVTATEVIEDLKLANALCDQVISAQDLDTKSEQLVEGALVTGAWFTKTVWRTDKGQPYMIGPSGEIIYTGGVEITTPGVFDVYYDISFPHWQDVPWVVTRTIKNRWDLIAQHPDMESEIRGLPSMYEERGPNTWFERTLIDDDMVYVYEFYARPSPAMPKGRMMFYSNDKTVYYDDDNQYGTLPVEPMIPEMVMTTGLGYPQFSNLMPAQEMLDNTMSAITTNQSQFAVQSVAVPRGAGINVKELNGMRFVSFTPQNVPGGGLPTPLQLSQTSPESFKFVDLLDRYLMDLSNLTGALTGTPPPGITSGVALATLSANALEFTQSITKSYQMCIEKTMMHALNAYKKFAHIEQDLVMPGRNNQMNVSSFSKDSLQNIKGIKLLTSNPIMQTIAGRLEIGEKLMAMPRELWPKYVAILEGRPIQELYKSDLSQEDLIFAENELMMKGELVQALATDDHGAHVQDHAGLLNDPKVRSNSNYLQQILDHMEDHKNLAQTTDPFLLAMVRTGKVPQTPPQNAPLPSQGAPNLNGPMAEKEIQGARPAKDALGRPAGVA